MYKTRESKALHDSLCANVFKKFTDQVGGDPEYLTQQLFNRFVVDDFAYGDDLYFHGIFKYFEEKVVPHKVAVYQAGIGLIEEDWFDFLKVSKDMFRYNLFVHDLSKFSAAEAFGYAMHDFKNPKPETKEQFERSWHHHKMNNPHHPEYWLNPNRKGKLEVLEMPNIYLAEMIADWIGAGKTYNTPLKEWVVDNFGKFVFGKETGRKAYFILSNLGIDLI